MKEKLKALLQKVAEGKITPEAAEKKICEIFAQDIKKAEEVAKVADDSAKKAAASAKKAASSAREAAGYCHSGSSGLNRRRDDDDDDYNSVSSILCRL